MSGGAFPTLRLRPRDPAERHRTSTPLELLFDLVFVVAVSLSSQALHHAEAENHLLQGAGGYLAVFFAIWWAWMNFTWFATSFDPDSWLYRISTFVQMAGALVIAAGSGPALAHGDITWFVVGYVIMRLVAIPQWIQVAVQEPRYRKTAIRYVGGIAIAQALWLIALVTKVSEISLWLLVPIILLELCVPAFAERATPTPWNAHHITERFSLFTLILLGESILASANAVIHAIEESRNPAALVGVAFAALTIVASMWWLYFAKPMHHYLAGNLRRAMTFGYVHFLVFAAAGAFSAGIEATVDALEGHTALSPIAARATLAIPVAVFSLAVWWLAVRTALRPASNLLILALIALMLASMLTSFSIALIAICAAAIVIVAQTSGPRSPAAPAPSPATPAPSPHAERSPLA
ncbi:MAG: low temperature requirement protein A [Aeromicrobium sp.]|nr:MAG: low temperature requirement protein A [Aeromicrobium sp.]